MPYFEQTIRIRTQLRGFMPVHLLGAYYNQAVAMFGQGQVDEAELLLFQTLADWEQVHGIDNRASFRYVCDCLLFRTSTDFTRPGHVYFTLGHIQAYKGRMRQSFHWHSRALDHFLATVGDRHIYTAHAFSAVAEHCLQQNTRNVTHLLEQAVRIYKLHPNFKADMAGTYFRYARVLGRHGLDTRKESEMLDKAADCLNAVFPHARYRGSDLKEENFYGLGTVGLT